MEMENTRMAKRHLSRADVNAVVLEVEALSAVISLSLSHWSWQRRRQPNLNKSFIAE